jgi:hypothetical protein
MNAVDGKEARDKGREILVFVKEIILYSFPHPKKENTYQLKNNRAYIM